MWYPTDCPILESVFVDYAPHCADLHEIFGNFPTRPYSYRELSETVAEGFIF